MSLHNFPPKALELIKNAQKFRESKEFEFFKYLQDNRVANSIVRNNFFDLRSLNNYHNKQILNHDWFSNNSNRWKLQEKLIRNIFNYLSSIFFLIDFSRVNHPLYLQGDDEIVREYDIKRTRFSENGLHRFIQGLRNYFTHCTFPRVVSAKQLNINWEEPRINIYLNKEDLLEYKKWDSYAKSFINSQPEKVYIIDIIHTHYNQVITFQNWAYLNIILMRLNLVRELYTTMVDLVSGSKSESLSIGLPIDDIYCRYFKYIISKVQRN